LIVLKKEMVFQEGTAELQLPSEAVGAAEDIVFFRAQALMLMMTMIQHLKTYQASKEKQYRMLRHGDGMVSVIKSRQVWRTIQQR
jgi:hypothetical protein